MEQQNDILVAFAKRFLLGRINWWDLPRSSGVTNFGNIVSLVLYRKKPFQVELFIVPDAPSSFTEHKHPNVDVIQFGLTGDAGLFVNSKLACSEADVLRWMNGEFKTPFVRIHPTDWHSGLGRTPYAFLSIQHWLNGVEPTSVGIEWEGEPSSVEQEALWNL